MRTSWIAAPLLALGLIGASAGIAEARDGCGPGFHRGFYGYCRPNMWGPRFYGGYGYRRFGWGGPRWHHWHRWGGWGGPRRFGWHGGWHHAGWHGGWHHGGGWHHRW
jgi:hypothetical protein